MTLTFRRDLARTLTVTEFDGNTDEIAAVKDRVDDIEGASALSIDPDDPIEDAGDQFYIRMTDATLRGPYSKTAIEWNPRGTWAADTVYAKHDIFTAIGNLYETIFAHTSESTFDPDANDGDGHDFYRLLIPSFTISYPVENADETIDLTLADVNTFIECTAEAGATVNISFDFVTDMPLGSETHFVQSTDGQVSFIVQDDSEGVVTLKYRFARLAMTAANGSTVTLKKIGATTVRLFGDLALDDGSDSSA